MNINFFYNYIDNKFKFLSINYFLLCFFLLMAIMIIIIINIKTNPTIRPIINPILDFGIIDGEG